MSKTEENRRTSCSFKRKSLREQTTREIIPQLAINSSQKNLMLNQKLLSPTRSLKAKAHKGYLNLSRCLKTAETRLEYKFN